jgi:hypothetical protein
LFGNQEVEVGVVDAVDATGADLKVIDIQLASNGDIYVLALQDLREDLVIVDSGQQRERVSRSCQPRAEVVIPK